VRKDKIIVEPMHGIEAAIPAWEGELIPVPCAVAQDVGRLRGALAAEHSQPLSQYPLAKNVSRKLIAAAQKQKSWGFVPTDKNLLLEYGTLTNKEGMSEHYVIIHTCFGSLVNETIGRTLSILLTDQLGSVGFQSDPYRIMLKLPVLDWDAVVECLKGLTKEKMKTVLETALPTTELFRWRFLNCAKRFGIIAKDAEFGKGYLKKIIEVYANTPLYREALNELFQEKLDLEQAAQMLEDLKKGISLEIRKGISPLGHAGLARNYEIVAQEKPEQEIFSVFKKRLLETRVGFVCMQCGFSFGGYSVQRVKRIICTRCGARLVSTVPPRWLREAEKLVKKHIHKRTLTHEEQKLIEYMQRSSSLIITHELDAVKAIAGRGVGPRTAARILGRGHTGDALLRDILEAERTYARNKRFWRD
jgi:ATP-dependent Lhr-like helicase